MLCKIGDVWVDPLRVVALEYVPATEPRAIDGTLSTWQVMGSPAYVAISVVVGDDCDEVNAHGVELDEAARLINRGAEHWTAK
jgi:hypothetical protein